MTDIAAAGNAIVYCLPGKALYMQAAGFDYNLWQLWCADGTASWPYDHPCAIIHHPAIDDTDRLSGLTHHSPVNHHLSVAADAYRVSLRSIGKLKVPASRD